MCAPLSPSESAELLARQGLVQQALSEFGAGVEMLADGTVVATVLPSASVADQAFLAARCGLLLKRRLPDAEVAVAAGLGLLRDQFPIGEATDRALQLLKNRTTAELMELHPTGVWLDAPSEDLIAGRFQIVSFPASC